MNKKYKSSAELKALAKERLLGKYGTVIGASVIVAITVGLLNLLCTVFINTTTLPGLILQFIMSFVISVLAGLFSSGTSYLYLKISCGRPVTVSDVFYGFKMAPDKALLIQLYLSALEYIFMLPMTIFSFLVLLYPHSPIIMLVYSLANILYLVAIVMVSLIYAQAFYLLHDFPDYSVKQLLTMSRQLMKGNKGRFFYLNVSFLPIMLLGLLSCGIAFLWLVPYMNAACTEFFLDLIKNNH
ncbi:MAG: DUF975 family protein [Roseburia sp.]|nr:DUF975 family protein [Ruminococcus sp.]MCM1153848.1 DUF975 family protein [Roseburia sp.]MCM1241400.1 DUF975 family protein [Roseburia sp.]